jgi:hypothetical protein
VKHSVRHRSHAGRARPKVCHHLARKVSAKPAEAQHTERALHRFGLGKALADTLAMTRFAAAATRRSSVAIGLVGCVALAHCNDAHVPASSSDVSSAGSASYSGSALQDGTASSPGSDSSAGSAGSASDDFGSSAGSAGSASLGGSAGSASQGGPGATGPDGGNDPTNADESATYTDADCGNTVRTNVGESFAVSLASTYWQFQSLPAAAPVKQSGDITFSTPVEGCPAFPGSGCGIQTLHLESVAAGRAVISASRGTCGEAEACGHGEGIDQCTIVVAVEP